MKITLFITIYNYEDRCPVVPMGGIEPPLTQFSYIQTQHAFLLL